MSFIVRFICCANPKEVNEEEERHEKKLSKVESKDQTSPHFGEPSNDAPSNDTPNITPKQQNQANRDENDFTAISRISTKSENTHKITQAQLAAEDYKKNSTESHPRNSALVKDKDLSPVSNNQGVWKSGPDAVQLINNLSLMSIQVDENQEESGKKITIAMTNKSNEVPKLDEPKSGDTSPQQNVAAAVMKGGFVMKKLDRSHENNSSGLSNKNIFESNEKQPRKSGKRGDLNSTPIMNTRSVKQA